MDEKFFKLGIIGNPLAHSISPIIQSEALKSTGLNGIYEKFEIPIEGLRAQLKFFADNNFTGFNVTIPYKIEIMQYLDKIDFSAEKIGAVNTVKISDTGSMTGYNTDIYGFVQAISENKKAKIKNAKLLGCGGAALAVIFGLCESGAENITIAARNQEKAQEFVKKLEHKIKVNFNIEDINTPKSLENIDVLVNATPLGTKGKNENFSPISTENLSTANKNILIYDLVYNPQETLLLKNAKLLDLNAINGLDMLILQGVKAFEIWTNQTPSIQIMKIAALTAL